jgi:type II secretory pathway pseudopilin PulG
MRIRHSGTFWWGEGGYAMAALLVGMSIMAVALSVALPIWHTAAKRERETELIFRGQQYARAISLFQRKYANAFPPNLDILLNERFLRKKYKDPMTKDGEFQLLYIGAQPAAGVPQAGRGAQPGIAPGPVGIPSAPAAAPGAPAGVVGAVQGGARGGITGVASKSTEKGFRLYNGREKYNEWAFVAVQASLSAGAPTGGPDGRGGQPGRGGVPPGRGGRSPQNPGGVGAPGTAPFSPQPPGGRQPGGFPPAGPGGFRPGP